MESRRFLPGKTQVQPLPGANAKVEGRRQKDETGKCNSLHSDSSFCLHPSSFLPGCVAQRQSVGLISPRLMVRVHPSPILNFGHVAQMVERGSEKPVVAVQVRPCPCSENSVAGFAAAVTRAIASCKADIGTGLVRCAAKPAAMLRCTSSSVPKPESAMPFA
jgi:hypothetical protein